MTPAPSPLLVSAKRAADLCDVSPATFRKWVDEGIVPEPVRIGGCVRWNYTALSSAINAASGVQDAPAKGWEGMR